MPGANCLGYNTISPTTYTTCCYSINGTTAVLANPPHGAKGAILSIETAAVRWRIDGTDPTTGTGHPQAAASTLTFDSWTAPGSDWGEVMKKLRFIGAAGTPTIFVSYFD